MSTFKMPPTDIGKGLWDEDAFFESTLKQALRDVLEHAAQRCTDNRHGFGITGADERCAALIRTMIGEIK